MSSITVEELIERLKELPQDYEVYAAGVDTMGSWIMPIEAIIPNDKYKEVRLEG